MSPSIGDVRLPERAVRWLGIGLIVAGLLLPFAILLLRAARWEPPEQVNAEDAPQLRPEMVILPPGTFEMGSPEDEAGRNDDETLHTVTLTRGFMMSRTEVTQGQYAAVVGERPMKDRRDEYFGRPCSAAGQGDDLPVVCIDWFEAARYCNALSGAEGLKHAYEIDGEQVTWLRDTDGYRLPTEAEWEYAARALSRSVWVGTDIDKHVCTYANVADASAKRVFEEEHPDASFFPCDDGFEMLSPVERFPENRWRLYGLGGNAAEWVWDFFGAYSIGPAEDPVGVDASDYRVIRGGSWWHAPRSARVADRLRGEPSARNDDLGFRVARSLPSAN